jgi:DegV family protein with EDD domain
MQDREIHLIDSATTSAALGVIVLQAADAAATGATGTDVDAAVRGTLPRTEVLFAVDTLEYLRKGGRLSAARAAIGTVLSVKPIITVRDGEVVVAEQQRTRSRVRDRIVELVAARPVERLAIVGTPASTDQEVAAFRDRIVAAVPGGVDPARVTIGLVGATTGPHLGPGVLGAAFIRPA